MNFDVVDLFAGAGGWSEGLKNLGVIDLGFEIDPDACNTRRINQHLVIEDDVTKHNPLDYQASGFIASPPCQTFSSAGKRTGHQHIQTIMKTITSMNNQACFNDQRTSLVYEPFRWIHAMIQNKTPYEWIALEEVKAVLPIWREYKEYLLAHDYQVFVQNIKCNDYGVPQKRQRAILLASLSKNPTPLITPNNTPASSLLNLESRFDWIVTGGRTSRYSKVDPRIEICPTITGAGNTYIGNTLDWEDYRQLTIPELAKAQSFSPNYTFTGNKSAQRKQIGNAVPPLLAENLLKNII